MRTIQRGECVCVCVYVHTHMHCYITGLFGRRILFGSLLQFTPEEEEEEKESEQPRPGEGDAVGIGVCANSSCATTPDPHSETVTAWVCECVCVCSILWLSNAIYVIQGAAAQLQLEIFPRRSRCLACESTILAAAAAAAACHSPIHRGPTRACSKLCLICYSSCNCSSLGSTPCSASSSDPSFSYLCLNNSITLWLIEMFCSSSAAVLLLLLLHSLFAAVTHAPLALSPPPSTSALCIKRSITLRIRLQWHFLLLPLPLPPPPFLPKGQAHAIYYRKPEAKRRKNFHFPTRKTSCVTTQHGAEKEMAIEKEMGD